MGKNSKTDQLEKLVMDDSKLMEFKQIKNKYYHSCDKGIFEKMLIQNKIYDFIEIINIYMYIYK